MDTTTARALLPRSTAEAMSAARDAYAAGNNAGRGFAPAAEDVDTAAESYEVILLPRQTSDDVAVCLDGERLIAIGGDASGKGAWAVDITDALSE